MHRKLNFKWYTECKIFHSINSFVILNLFKINKIKLIVFYPLFSQKGSENSAARYHRSCTHRNCHCLADGSAHHRSSHRHRPSHHTTHTRYSPAVHMGLTHLCKQSRKRQKAKTQSLKGNSLLTDMMPTVGNIPQCKSERQSEMFNPKTEHPLS